MTIDLRQALDRSLLLLQDYVEASDEDVLAAMVGTQVQIKADEQALASGSGRAALLATFDSVARLGTQITLDLPDVEVALPPGYLAGLPIAEALIERSTRLPGTAIRGSDGELRLTLARYADPDQLALGGGNTSAALTVGESAGGWRGELPFGGGLAGAAAGAEVARLIIRKLRKGRKPVNPLRLEHQPLTIALPQLTVRQRIDLGSVDFVSAGAVTHALLFLLHLMPNLRVAGRVFDNDLAHGDNLNRYFLLTSDLLEQSKVSLLETLNTDRITLTGIDRRLEGATSLGSAQPLADRVCVGVDSVEGRWVAQQLAPGWVGVGATSHAHAVASEHWPGHACAACIHPATEELDARLPTISFVSLLAGTALAHRLVASRTSPDDRTNATSFLNAFNLTSPDAVVEEQFELNPNCPLHCSERRT